MGSTACEVCALHESGEKDRAIGIEALRSQQLLLAFLSGDRGEVPISDISAHIGNCFNCAARLAAAYLGGYAQAVVILNQDDINRAKQGIQQLINELERNI